MFQIFEADKNALLSVGLLSANVHSVLSKLAKDPRATSEQKRIISSAIQLTNSIKNGKIARPEHDQFLALPTPAAAKARTIAIRAWGSGTLIQQNGDDPNSFDQMMEDYLRLFEEIVREGRWKPDREPTARQAKSFFSKLNQVVIDSLNGLVDEETPILPDYQIA